MMQMARPQSPRHTYRMMRPMTMPLAVSAMWPATFPAAPAVEMPRSMPLPDEGNPGMFEEEEPTGNPVGYGVGRRVGVGNDVG